jgi:lysyl-tRNA synthetase class 2
MISNVAQKKGYSVRSDFTWEQVFNQIFLNEIESHLGSGGKPTIIYDFPLPLAALAKVKKGDPRLAQRFEFCIAGLELGDCYDESTDTSYLKKRYNQELDAIKKLGKTRIRQDKEFLQAMSFLNTPYSGIAVGVDRLCMLFADTRRIQDVLLFPTQTS